MSRTSSSSTSKEDEANLSSSVLRMNLAMKPSVWYRIGDVLAGALLGTFIALIETLVGAGTLPWPSKFVLVMLFAMIAQEVFAIAFGSFLGNVEMAVPGFITAILAMFVPELTDKLWLQAVLGALLGANTFVLFELWDIRVRGHGLHMEQRESKPWAAPPNLRCWWYDFQQRGGNRRRAWIQRPLLMAARGEVLLAGVGTGLNLLYLPKRDDVRLIAVDQDEDFLLAAARRGADLGLNLECALGDVEHLVFPENSFDTVISIATLCSVGSPRAALAEYSRVLKPGGTLILFEHVRSSNPMIGALMSLMDRLRSRTAASMSRETLKDVSRAGFTVTNVTCAYADIYLGATALKANSHEHPALGGTNLPGQPMPFTEA